MFEAFNLPNYRLFGAAFSGFGQRRLVRILPGNETGYPLPMALFGPRYSVPLTI